ncbi:ATP-binding protein [Corallococcus sp. CA053C]|uniref:DEAD/DEAH box helicase n=1 Tax=Corallococcus sp. CA053C TaxID=2316732 RepID=UPI0018F66871|nr:AAA domain-containing protein [Corallococcus sp. CA053C]
MQAEDLKALGQMPFHREKTRRRLELWREYLQWKEKLVKEQQIKVPYLAWSWVDTHRLVFFIKGPVPGPRGLVGQELGATPPEEKEDTGVVDPARKSRRRSADAVALGEVEKVGPLSTYNTPALQRWEGVRKDNAPQGQLILLLDEDVAERLQQKEGLIPEQGVLVSSLGGDLAPLLNQRQAIQRLQNSQGFCPRLADFLFTATSASVPTAPAPEWVALPGTRALNQGQVEAVTKALAAPDLCLIQGPPGTGKTTVIAELCLRVTAEGGRVLVASQTNLAVDNALSRLADRPNIRRLRLGNADKVDEDFKDFLAEHVVDRWFATIAEACTERIDETDRLESAQVRTRQGLEQLRHSLKDHEASHAAWTRLEERLTEARHSQGAAYRQVQRAQEQRDATHHHAELLRSLQAWADGSGGPPTVPETFSLPELDELVREVRADLSPEDPVRTRGGLQLLDAVGSRDGTLEPLRRLMAEGRRLCEEGVPGAAQDELTALRAQRDRLARSEDEAETLQLPALNRRIKQLQGEEWAGFTKQLDLLALRCWGAPIPLCVQHLTDALRPNVQLLQQLDALERLIAHTEAACARSQQARRTLSSVLGTRSGEAVARAEEAVRALRTAEVARGHLQAESKGLRDDQRARQQEVDAARERWSEAWRALHPAMDPPPPVPSSTAFEAAAQQVRTAQQAAAPHLLRRKQWHEVQHEWRERLGQASDSDRDQLQSLYVRHANVVGMTCNEAGKKQHFQAPDFRPFDMVIIDEVSKATPTELIMPMMLGRKVVLVGDHRQLPPMFREREASFAEAQAEGGIEPAIFRKYQRLVTASLFQELFEAAPPELRAMLWVQYRMHPQVMDAVNEFYGGRLQPGASPGDANPRQTLDRQRQHHLRIPDDHGGLFLEPHQHLLWVDSSKDARDRPHWEEQRGTSKVNRLEVELVMATLRRLNDALLERGYGQCVELRVEPPDAGMPLRDFVRYRLARPHEATLDDLFAEKRIRIQGRSRKPEDSVQRGDLVNVDARRQIGVITFYGAQLKALREAIDRKRSELDALEVRANTVDRFQGMERPIIIASLVRSARGNLGEFVRQFQRINVGFSRAQELLVIVGAADTFKRALIELPPLEQAGAQVAPEQKAVYERILGIATRAGGRRHARQVLS